MPNVDFSYIKEGDYFIIQKHSFPCFKATFDYKTPLPQLIDIEFSNVCNAEDIAKALSELDAFMKSVRKEIRNC